MQSVVPRKVRAHAMLEVQLLYYMWDAPHVVVTTFLIENTLVPQLSMFAVLMVASAGLGNLYAFCKSRVGNQSLVLNKASLNAFDDFLAMKLIFEVILQNSLPVALPVDVHMQDGVDHVLVDHANIASKKLIISEEVFVEVCPEDITFII